MDAPSSSVSPSAPQSPPPVEKSWLGRLLLRMFEALVLDRPILTLCLTAAVSAFFLIHLPDFKLDASPESLILEHDADLTYFREINKAYKSSDYLIITWTPNSPLLSDKSLQGLKGLKRDLEKLSWVKSITSVLDVPLLDSPRITFSELKEGPRSLEQTPEVDRKLALKEFRTSPIYGNLLVSEDGKTTAVQVNLYRDDTYFNLLEQRNGLRDKRDASGLTSKEAADLQAEFRAHLTATLAKQEENVSAVRAIMDKYRGYGRLFLGGLPMITVDIIDFIEHDLVVFGLGVLAFLVAALWFFFRKPRWVLLPLTCCALTSLTMLGYLGFVDWRVTVISSNFVSILLIVTMQLTIHLIVRYGELKAEHPDWSQRDLVRENVRLMAPPCFFTAVTTIAAFSSLVVSDIRPVIDFGWMMTIGIVFGFVLSFVVWPALLMLMRPAKAVSEKDFT
ncbi:MAG: RND family transporter, partial [Nitrospinaceae bacterium]